MKFLIIIALIIIAPSASYSGEGEDGWGPFMDGFLLPLTYPDFDPTDFGEKRNGDKGNELLEQYRPRVYIAPNGLAPINLYDDYLPHCVVRDFKQNDAIVDPNPTREALKKIERTYGMYLDYQGPDDLQGAPTAYGRVYRESVSLMFEGQEKKIDFVFLKYNFVFLKSGLPAKLSLLKSVAARLAGDLENWHELDIHGAIIIALAKHDGTLIPAALTLAQHNHFRTYLFGRDVEWPVDSRVRVSYAERSNEPYPTPNGPDPAHYRAVGHPKDFSYALTGKGLHLTSGTDLAYSPEAGATELEYEITELPDRDPFYVAWINLGAKAKLFGLFDSFYRVGPPGADMCTWPELKEYGRTMQFWFMDDGDRQAARLFDDNVNSFTDARLGPIYQYTSRNFVREFFRLHPELVESE